jgi:hypothetical protein
MHKPIVVLLWLLVAGVPAGRASADHLIESTSAWDGQYSLGNLAPGSIWGQTFTGPAAPSQLTAASFWLTPYGSGPQFPPLFDVAVTAYVMPWDGAKAALPFVAQNTASIMAEPWKMNRLDFDFASATLAASHPYVIFFQIAPADPLSYATFGYVPGNPYSAGRFMGPYAGSFANLTNRAWSGPPSGDDLAFELQFAAVPEPSTWALAVLGFLGLVVVCHRAQRACSVR